MEHELEVAAYSGETLDIQLTGGSIRIVGVPFANTVRLRAIQTGGLAAVQRGSAESASGPDSETAVSTRSTRSGSTVTIRRKPEARSDETHGDLPWPLRLIFWRPPV